MRSPSGTIQFVVLAAVGVLAILSVKAFAQSTAAEPNTTFFLKIKKTHEVKDEAAFLQVLQNVKKKGAIYKIHMVKADSSTQDLSSDAAAGMKTDQVITSQMAKNVSSDKFTAIGVQVTQTVASEDPTDLAAILNALK